MPKANDLSARRGPRYILIGVALAVADLLLILTIGTFGKWALDPPSGSARLVMICAIVIFSMVAVGCAVLSWRLLTGRGRRSDGGLMSPLFLRLASLGLVVGVVAALVWSPVWSLWSLFEVAFAIGLAGGAFGLARKREARGATDSSDGAPIEPT